MNCQKGGCSCKQTQPNSTNFFFCPGPLATFCWPNLPIKIDIFSMDFDPNLEENYPRLQKLLVLVGSWTSNPTRLRFKAQAKQHQKGGGASNLWTRKVASPSLSLFTSMFVYLWSTQLRYVLNEKQTLERLCDLHVFHQSAPTKHPL